MELMKRKKKLSALWQRWRGIPFELRSCYVTAAVLLPLGLYMLLHDLGLLPCPPFYRLNNYAPARVTMAFTILVVVLKILWLRGPRDRGSE